jgi:nucleoside-diphosphate-sugar epimerase
MTMSPLNGETVFITGATGFIGSNLTRRALDRGADVYINQRKSSDTWRIADILGDVTSIPVDITEYEKLSDSLKRIHPSIIFHTAVYGGAAKQKDIGKIIETNIQGTVNVLRSCMSSGFNLFVNTGSSSEYGLKNTPMNESALLEPVTDYGVSKAAATLFCKCKAYNDNLPVVTLRLFSPYGRYEHRTRLIPSVILAAIQKNNPQIASRQFVRDFIFIEDVLDAYESLIDLKNPSGKIFNIGSGRQHTVGEVTDIIVKLFGNEVTPETTLSQVWKNEPQFWQADINRAKSELNWEPKYSLESGLAMTIKWFQENIGLYK